MFSKTDLDEFDHLLWSFCDGEDTRAHVCPQKKGCLPSVKWILRLGQTDVCPDENLSLVFLRKWQIWEAHKTEKGLAIIINCCLCGQRRQSKILRKLRVWRINSVKRLGHGTLCAGSFGVIKELEASWWIVVRSNPCQEPPSGRPITWQRFQVTAAKGARPQSKKWIRVFNYDSSGLTGDKKPVVFISSPHDWRWCNLWWLGSAEDLQKKKKKPPITLSSIELIEW